MTNTSWAGVMPPRRGLPEELVIWEILVRLPPKSILRCRAVCRAWRQATSTRLFLQAHHDRQPSLPIVSGSKYSGARHENILTFDHQAAAGSRLQPAARLEYSFYPEASCDGLLIFSSDGGRMSICNPATRQHAPLWQLSGFIVLAIYAHRPSGEYRLLLQRTDRAHYYVFVLGSDQPIRYVGMLEEAGSAYLCKPTMVHHRLHWYPRHLYPVNYCSDSHQYQTGSKAVIVFDTTSESFQLMRAPDVPAKSYIFEMGGTLGIYNYNETTQIVDIWILQNYESEVWGHMYNVKLPAADIKCRYGLFDNWHVNVYSVDGDLLLLVSVGGWMFYVDIDGKLVDDFHYDGQHVSTCELRLKQTLVSHTFFTALEGYVVNASPFV